MILSDNEIGLLCEGEQPMISPFLASQISANNHGARLLSYGVSSYGYDVQLAEQFQIFSNQDATLIDPKRLDPQSLKDAKIHLDPETQEKYAILPPHSYGLSYTKQYLRIPNDVLVICLGKSTYARCGIHTNVTPLEPGWCGNVVIEISNSTSLPVKIYLDEGIAQFVFLRGKACRTSYADRNGKYQGQEGITLARV